MAFKSEKQYLFGFDDYTFFLAGLQQGYIYQAGKL